MHPRNMLRVLVQTSISAISLVAIFAVSVVGCRFFPDNSDQASLTDADRDGIPDRYEAEGERFRGMPLYEWGARPGQQDYFVHVDYMSVDEPGYYPDRKALRRVVEFYEEYGIFLHMDVGDLYHGKAGSAPADYDLSDKLHLIPEEEFIPIQWRSDDGYNDEYLEFYYEPMGRDSLFYYMIFLKGIEERRFGKGQNYGVRTAYSFDATRIDDLTYTTFEVMTHEFGHNLGMAHGGPVSLTGEPDVTNENSQYNFKPNYLSHMNYMWYGTMPTDADSFLYRYYSTHSRHWSSREDGAEKAAAFKDLLLYVAEDNRDYFNAVQEDPYAFVKFSSGKGLPLDERSLDETAGLPGYFTCEVDWNADGRIQTDVAYDINLDGELTVLKDYNDAAHFRHYFASP